MLRRKNKQTNEWTFRLYPYCLFIRFVFLVLIDLSKDAKRIFTYRENYLTRHQILLKSLKPLLSGNEKKKTLAGVEVHFPRNLKVPNQRKK